MMRVKPLSRVRLFATPWTVAYQASLSMGFSRQEYWNGVLFPSGHGFTFQKSGWVSLLMHALDMISVCYFLQKAAAVSVVRILIRSISAVPTQHKTG